MYLSIKEGKTDQTIKFNNSNEICDVKIVNQKKK